MTHQPSGTDSIEVPTTVVTAVAQRALLSLGLTQDDANTVLDVLMYAQQRGSTQGLIKIVEKTIVPLPNAKPITLEQKKPGLIHLAANGNAGMVVMTRATELVVEAAGLTGVAIVATRGTASSTGAIGYYATRIADAGMIGLVLAGSPASTAVHGGVDPVMGTNPIAVAVPGARETLVFDMATAATTVFGLIEARDAGQPIDEGLAWDRAGRPTRDAAAALDGAIQTFGGAKGSGLALVFEILTGSLSGAALPDEQVDNRGNFLLAIDPSGTVGRQVFGERVDTLLAHVLASRPVNPGAPVRLPGNRAAALAQEADQSGLTTISHRVWAALQAMAQA